MDLSFPENCVDVETAANILGINRKELYKKLREMRWLYTGTYKDDPHHNSPCYWAKVAGLATTHERKRPADHDKRVKIVYRITVITERGLDELINILVKKNKAHFKPELGETAYEKAAEEMQGVRYESAPHAVETPAHDKAIKELRAMGVLDASDGV
jgi:hypothetical protein